MAEKKEVPRHEKDYEKLKKEYTLLKKTRDTMNLYHTDVLTSAMKKHLLDDSGEIDYARLKKKDYQNKLSEEITKGYDTLLANYYQTNLKGLSAQRKELMRQGLFGVNKGFLDNKIEQLQDKFTLDYYSDQIIPQHLEHVVQTLMPGTYAHINPEDHLKLLKLAKLDDQFDEKSASKINSPLMKNSIGQLLFNNHSTKGRFKPELYQELGLTPYMKTDR